MTVRVVRLPDVGEGIAEAELVEWHVAVGDRVSAETVLADVMTDKATVEISAPVAGTITFVTGAPGDVLQVGADFVGIETDETVTVTADGPSPPASATAAAASTPPDAETSGAADLPEDLAPPAAEPRRSPQTDARSAARPVAAPAVRQRARDLGVDLRLVAGSGPAGRITHTDLDAFVAGDHLPGRAHGAPRQLDATHERTIVGLRRRIAERMSLSASEIPHITYVDEVDMSALEDARAQLNREWADRADAPRLTVLPFLCRAIARAVVDQPHLNATFDGASRVLTTWDAVHVGIATQTPNGLLVPVVRHVEGMDLWTCAAEIAAVTEAARTGAATREQLSGSTITITSLGALGGLVTTPIINHPEVAIVGVNKMQIRPSWDGTSFVPRTMMNLSSSFDHRIVDGWDAATFVQRIKALLEAPALLLVDGPPR